MRLQLTENCLVRYDTQDIKNTEELENIAIQLQELENEEARIHQRSLIINLKKDYLKFERDVLKAKSEKYKSRLEKSKGRIPGFEEKVRDLDSKISEEKGQMEEERLNARKARIDAEKLDDEIDGPNGLKNQLLDIQKEISQLHEQPGMPDYTTSLRIENLSVHSDELKVTIKEKKKALKMTIEQRKVAEENFRKKTKPLDNLILQRGRLERMLQNEMMTLEESNEKSNLLESAFGKHQREISGMETLEIIEQENKQALERERQLKTGKFLSESENLSKESSLNKNTDLIDLLGRNNNDHIDLLGRNGHFLAVESQIVNEMNEEVQNVQVKNLKRKFEVATNENKAQGKAKKIKLRKFFKEEEEEKAF